MKLLRNPLVGTTLIIMLAATVLSGIAALLFGREACFAALAASAVMIVIHVLSDRLRYKRIAALSDEIDSVLHNEERTLSGREAEGELSLLRNEVQKLIIRIREQNTQLAEEKKALADAMADISHQLRTPLTSINLQLSLLSKPDVTDQDRARLLAELRRRLMQVEWLVESLLKMSRLDAGSVRFRRDTRPLAELVEKACEPLLIPVELRGQTLETQAEGEYTGDTDWLAEALTNILKNCMEHTPVGGLLRVVAEENPIFSEIRISDNGEGIPPQELPHIFERFYRGSSAVDGGVGIGLSLARMIITSQSGTIKVESRPGKGTRFTVKLYKRIV